MKPETRRRLDDLIETYNRTIKVMEPGAEKAIEEEGRAYGGVIRAVKGQLQEFITKDLVQITWNVELNKDANRLNINSEKIPIKIRPEYVEDLKDQAIKKYIKSKLHDYYYDLSVDRHIFIDGNFVIGIECKAYAELSMFKRILVDFHLLKTIHPNLLCYLFQLENMLGGDYSSEIRSPKGSESSHTVMSYFPDVDLKIITLLTGERKVKKPIHKAEFFKPLTIDRLEVAVEAILEGFKKCKAA